MSSSHRSWIYILASRKNGTLYVGVTTDLRRRIEQHRTGLIAGFTKQYGVTTLVYFEELATVGDAIAREKTIKGWRRSRKIALIEIGTPDWDDLAKGWLERPLGPSHGSG
jgi:putative endonuclease